MNRSRISWPPIAWRHLIPKTHRGAGVMAAIVLLSLWIASGQTTKAEEVTWSQREMLDAIRWVESSNRINVPDGDNGRAIGPYQIHRIYWLDAHEYEDELGGTYQDCRNRDYAERVIDAYMRRYAKEAWRIGRAEKVARVHNGGPKGHKKKATDRYWQRVLKRLTRRSN